MVIAGTLSAVLANDVVVFAMTPVLCAGLLRRGPDTRPFVIALAGGANAGSAATIVGNPQNILIGAVGGLDSWPFLSACAPPALAGLGRWRRWLQAHAGRSDDLAPPLDRAGLAKAVFATLLLLELFATPLPHVEGILLVAGYLLISRRRAMRTMRGLVDWHLLVLFGRLFVVTHALGDSGLPDAAMRALADAGVLSLAAALVWLHLMGYVGLVGGANEQMIGRWSVADDLARGGGQGGPGDRRGARDRCCGRRGPAGERPGVGALDVDAKALAAWPLNALKVDADIADPAALRRRAVGPGAAAEQADPGRRRADRVARARQSGPGPDQGPS